MILGFRSGQVDYLLPGNHGNWYNLSHGLSGDGWDWTSWALWWTMPVSVRWHTLLQGQRLTNQSFCQSLQQMRGTVCLACQAWASRPAKAFSTYTTLQVVFMKWSIRWMLDVAGQQDLCWHVLKLKSMLGDRRKKRDVALNVAEWNVCTLMDRSAS